MSRWLPIERWKGNLWAWRKRLRPRRGVAVLTYHGVVEAVRDPVLHRNCIGLAEFREQIAFIKRFPYLDCGGIPEFQRHGGASHLAVAITFDDGYANNLIAFDELKKAGLNGTLFVSTGPVDARSTIWTVKVSLLLLDGPVSRVELYGSAWDLSSRDARLAAFREIRVRLKGEPASRLSTLLHELEAQYPVGCFDELLSRRPEFQMLTWDQVAQLSSAGVEIGSHGVDHHIHHAAQEPDTCVQEIAGSKQALEARLRRPCRSFAFPNGDHLGAQSAAMLQQAGYGLAFTTEVRSVSSSDHPLLLPRLQCGTAAGLYRKLPWNTERTA